MTSLSHRPGSVPQADPGRSSYWLLVGGGEFSPRVFTTRLGSGERALVVFGFVEEGEMYLRSDPEVDESLWGLHRSSVEELLCVLWGQCARVGHVVMDPLPKGLSEKLSGPTIIMGRQEFMEFVMGRRPAEGSLVGPPEVER